MLYSRGNVTENMQTGRAAGEAPSGTLALHGGMKKYLLLLLLALFTAGYAYAQAEPDPLPITGYLRGFDVTQLADLNPTFRWLPLSILASMAVILAYTVILMISRAFNLQEIERHAKSEMYNAAATIILAAFLITILQSLEAFTLRQFLCGDSGCPSFECAGDLITIDKLKNSLDLLQCRTGDKASAFANLQEQVTEAAGGFFGPLNMLNTYFGIIGIPIIQGGYFSYLFREAETYRLLNHLLTALLIGTNALSVVAQYVKNNMLTFFLPLGLLLRSTYFTRGIGAFLMSLAIGLYFIFPLVYIITDPGFVKPTFKAPDNSQGQTAPLCYPTFSGLSNAVYSSLLSPQASAGGSQLSLDELRSDVASVYASVILQPFIAFAISMIFVRYLMYIFGGEPQDLLRAVAKVI